VYATCLFCNSALGANEAIEHFPVGRRLAYDAAGGRLWVVCRTCERWNLSPLESRWEAIEETERAFRGTRVRVSSDNIAMARLKDGTELVRIGKPPKLEFAVWRYGDQFGRRLRKSVQVAAIPTTAGLAAAALMSSQLFWSGSMAANTLSAIMGTATFLNLGSSVASGLQTWRTQNKLRAVVHDEDGSPIHLNNVTAREMAFVTGGREFDWKLKVPRYLVKPTGRIARLLGVDAKAHYNNECVYLHGDVAVRALANALPHVNSDGAGKRGVRDAFTIVNDVSNVQQLLQRASRMKPKYRADYHMDDGQAALGGLPAPMRLALEMALHEDDERRAMEGELHELEQRWREADTIARIADGLFMPDSVGEQLQTLRDKGHQ
jgi:hypothetical protein